MRITVQLRAALATLAFAAAAGASAQTPAPVQPAPATPSGATVTRDELPLDRRTQRVEHIRTEDAGSRVDEVRAGGETKSITVQPKGQGEAGPGAPGRRVWKVEF